MIKNYNQSKFIRQEILSRTIIKKLINDKKNSMKEIHDQIICVSSPHASQYDKVVKCSNYVQVSTIVNSLLSDIDQLEKELKCLTIHLQRIDYYYECLLASCSDVDREIVQHYFDKDMKQVDIEVNYCITNINRYILRLIDFAKINLVNVSN